MKIKTRFAALLGVLALMLTPAAAIASGPEYAPEKPAHPVVGPNSSLREKTKAYGRYCRGFSKKHVKGQKQTPFSRCVTAMARAATSSTTTPKRACAGFSKVHVKGEQGTEFSRCVVAAAKVKKAQTKS